MTNTPLDDLNTLPPSIPFLRYCPDRPTAPRDCYPAEVRSTSDLPGYLILGKLDPSTFRKSETGWSARWQGAESDTYLDIVFNADADYCEFRRKWRGLDGPFGGCTAQLPLTQAISKIIGCSDFPANWDSGAKMYLESSYQLSVVAQPVGGPKPITTFGIPDGSFRTIAFALGVRNFRGIHQWLKNLIAEASPAYPVFAEARLVFQSINYVEGKAPEWTTEAPTLYYQSMDESGMVPFGLPEREARSDGTAAWTLRRATYFLFIHVPFAGLADFLARATNERWVVRTISQPPLRFESQPIVFRDYANGPAPLSVMDLPRTTRVSLASLPIDEGSALGEVEPVEKSESELAELFARVERISLNSVTHAKQSFEELLRKYE